VAALGRFLRTRPRDGELIGRAIERGVALILARQHADGAWPGFWGINFIYGTKFAVAGLREAGLTREHPAFRRAGTWLLSIQHDDGGWGEHFAGCLSGRYVDNPSSLVISTAWAVLALLEMEAKPSDATRRGIEWLVAHQEANGDWPRDSVNGVFFGTAMLDYRLYNTYFPAWALANFEASHHARH
jgi:lanosterol synthase